MGICLTFYGIIVSGGHSRQVVHEMAQAQLRKSEAYGGEMAKSQAAPM